jgi:hypothetical protein
MGQIFKKAEHYIDQLDPGSWVEIGCGRAGDNGSTRIIADWAARKGRYLFTVDIDPHHCDIIRLMALPNVEVVHDTGENFLEKFPKHIAYISFLYLDNFDWDWHPAEPTEEFVVDQKQRYSDLGMPEMNNLNSQRAHMRQAELAIKALGPKSLVICDDTWYNKWWGHYSGKCGSVVPFLMNHGFKILHTEEEPVYGTILGRGLTV